MKRILFALLPGFICLGAKAVDPVEAVLAKGGLTRNEVHFDRQLMDFYGGGSYRLKLFDLLADRPLDIPYYNQLFVHQLFQGGDKLSKGVFFVSLRTDASVRRGLIQHPYTAMKEELADVGDPFFYALDELNRVAGAEPGLYDFETPVWTEEFEEAFSIILLACAQAIEYRNLAFRNLSTEEQQRLWEKSLGYVGEDTSMTSRDVYFVEDCISRVEYPLLYAGLEDLTMILDSLLPALNSMELNKYRMEFTTPYGMVKIAGKDDDYYADENYLLLIETGGDDSYRRAGATWDVDHPLSVVIDLAGDDGYMNEAFKPSIGAGIMGAGIIIDLGGNDLYKSNGLGIGGGLFGLGLVYDRHGDDNYDGFTNCQGAGVFGAGILVDVDGADTYRGFRGIQGYGFTKGCGLLLDLAGDDFYIARNDSLIFPSQSPEHNANMAQGFGFGKRADFTDGYSLAGGIGVLADGGGNDIYDAGVFAQGTGYWYGVGMLNDASGDDSYSGVWYVQGSGAHFAIGVLNDVRGNDSYTAEKNMAQGAGHDFTVGYFLEEEGNDIYNAPNLSLGGGNANGFGIFWDRQGDDIYNVTAGTTLGLANTGSRGGLRDRCLCLGMFMDTGGGKDTYPEDKPAGNNKTWFQPGLNTDEPIETEVGVGLDQ